MPEGSEGERVCAGASGCARTGTGEWSLHDSVKDGKPLRGANTGEEERSVRGAPLRARAAANPSTSSSFKATTTSETTKRRLPARENETHARWSPEIALDRKSQGKERHRVLQQSNTASSSGSWTMTPEGDTEATRAVLGHTATAAMADSCLQSVRGPENAAPNSCTSSASPLAAATKSTPAHRAVAQGRGGAVSIAAKRPGEKWRSVGYWAPRMESTAPAAPLRQTLTLVNDFVISTSEFLSRFAARCEDRLDALSLHVARLETEAALLEKKLNSVPGLAAAGAEVPDVGAGQGASQGPCRGLPAASARRCAGCGPLTRSNPRLLPFCTASQHQLPHKTRPMALRRLRRHQLRPPPWTRRMRSISS